MAIPGSEAARWAARREGRLGVQSELPREAGPHGLRSLDLDRRRDAWLYVPPSYDPARPAPLIVGLHGAGGEGRKHLEHMRPQADAHGFLVLAPTSRQSTWDVLFGGYGPDVVFIGSAMEETFRQYAIDATRVAIEGFSDGASYALSIGLANGDLFTHVIAFSPGFMAPALREGTPRIFVSHGTQDQVLNINVCSRRLVPRLQNAGYDVRYVEFDGGHTVPPWVADDAIDWFLNPTFS